MRYTKDLLLERAVLHVIDHGADEPILADSQLYITEDVEEFSRKHVIKCLNDNGTYIARPLSLDEYFIKRSIDLINDPDQFIQYSRDITKFMFKITKGTDIPCGDILVVQFITSETRCYGVLKLDYQLSHKHNINMDDQDLHINLVTEELGLPGTGQAIKKCIFFTKSAEDPIELLVIDKTQKIEDGNPEYFLQDFLKCITIQDDTVKTRRFKPLIENWTTKNLSDQIEKANEVRETVREALLNEETIQVGEIADKMFNDNPEIRSSWIEYLEIAGFKDGQEFEIDKTYIEKIMKSKSIKTDTGFKIKSDLDIFKNAQKFVIKKNGDGTVDYIIKNVRNVIER